MEFLPAGWNQHAAPTVCRSPQKSNVKFTYYAALCNSSGEVTLSARYTPCPLAPLGMLREGDTLELNGTGNFRMAF